MPPDSTGPESGRPLRILHVLAPAPFGGLESVVRMLASGHRSRGHDVRVVSVLSNDDDSRSHPFIAALERTGIPSVVIRVGARAYGAERAAVTDLCRELRPDVLHTHGFRPDVVDGQVARRLGIATTSTVHSFIRGGWRGRIYEAIQRRALRRFDAVVAVSSIIRDRLQVARVPERALQYVQNAFAPGEMLPRAEARMRLGAPPDVPLVGWVGRFSREKGPDVMIEAFARVQHPRAWLAMIGDGRDAPELKARAMALGVGERILWPGRLPDAARLFSAFDVFALSSRTEGTPIGLLEAMAAGLPIVATRVGGVPDVLDDDACMLVASENAAALARAVDALLGDAETARHCAARARETVLARFAVGPWLDAYERIYRSIARQPLANRPAQLMNSSQGVAERQFPSSIG